MKYDIIDGKGIEIFGKEDFEPEHILECGQIFSYSKINKLLQVAVQTNRLFIFDERCKVCIF